MIRINEAGLQWLRAVGRTVMLLVFSTNFLVGYLNGGQISYELTPQGGNVYRYEFFPSNLALQLYQEFDIQFDPLRFGGLFNGAKGSDFRLSLLQPNNPIGALGHYSALALVDNPSLAGPFMVDVEWLGTGSPGGLPYVLHQFDPTGQQIVDTIGAGTVGTPEPATLSMGGVGVVLLGVSIVLRKARGER